MGRKVDARFFVFSLYEVPVPFIPHHYEIAVSAKCRSNGTKSSSGDAEKFKVELGLPTGEHGEVSGPPGSRLAVWDDDYPFALESDDDVGVEDCDDNPPQQRSRPLLPGWTSQCTRSKDFVELDFF